MRSSKDGIESLKLVAIGFGEELFAISKTEFPRERRQLDVQSISRE